VLADAGGHSSVTIRELMRLILCCLLLAPNLLLAQPQFVYMFTGTTNPVGGPVHTEAFQFTTPNHVTSYRALTAIQLDSCTACIPSGTAVEFYPNGTLSTIVPADFIRFTDATGVVFGYYFPPGSFTTPGTYHAFNYPPYITNDIATIIVQTIPPQPSPVPLPSSIVLALTGFVAISLYQINRRRRSSGRSANEIC
jgi:hypothetical protein